MPLLYHAYVYLEFLILACTIYILAPMSILELNNICVKIGLTKTEVNHMKQIIIVYYDGEKKVKEIRTIGK